MIRTAALLASIVLAASALAAELQPLVAGWEQHFKVQWQAQAGPGQALVSGRLENVSPYHVHRIRILVDALDAAGRVTAQKVAYVPGELLGFGGVPFQVVVPPAPAYRVRVFSYDRIEAPTDRR